MRRMTPRPNVIGNSKPTTLRGLSALRRECFIRRTRCRIDGYTLPNFNELHIEKGVYVSVKTGKGQYSGGILINGKQPPIVCNLIRLDLVGKEAMGWFDKVGHIYQLEVAETKVCEYEDIMERQRNKKPLMYFSMAAFFIFSFIQLGLFKLYNFLKG